MIQDIGDHVLDNTFQQSVPNPDDYVLCCHDTNILVRLSGQKGKDNSGRVLGGDLELPRVCELGQKNKELQLTYLLCVDMKALWLLQADVRPKVLGYRWEALRELRMARPRWLAFATAIGYQLAQWYRVNRYCGACGHVTMPVPSNRELICPSCGNVIYPRINPAVIVGVLDPTHTKLLLTHYAATHSRFPNYALVAGYTEIGETFEQTVVREVSEEVGLHVGRVRFWADQPWPFSASLLAGFWCEVEGSCDLVVGHTELQSATWLTRSQIPMPRLDSSSLTNAMITAFAEGFDPYKP